MKKATRDFSQKMGWPALGEKQVDVDVTLSSEQRIAKGVEMTDMIERRNKIEAELSLHNKVEKAKITQADDVISVLHQIVKTGIEIVTKTHECFFDPDKKERVFVEVETGEVVARTPAEYGDDQGSLI